MVVYGGDEVSAVVLDIGTSTTRAGYAGEDSPKSIIPTSYGYVPARDGKEAQHYFGQAGPNVWRAHQRVLNPCQDGIVVDWDAAEQLIHSSLTGQLRIPSLADSPLLTTEPSWNTKANRERMLEIAFETWQAPAYYTVDRAVLAAFSAGKGTALIVDIGQELATVTPVFDGFVLRKAIQKSSLAGGLLNTSLSTSFRTQQPPLQVRPHYLVKSKTPVEPGQPANAVYREERMPHFAPAPVAAAEGDAVMQDSNAGPTEDDITTASFHAYAEAKVMTEYKETTAAVFDHPWDEKAVTQRGSKPFEFPDGFNTYFGMHRYAIPEVLFNPRFLPAAFTHLPSPSAHSGSTIPTPAPGESVSIPHMIINAVNACDADVMPQLLLNIVVVGGTTSMPGFTDRLQREMESLSGSLKVKIHAPGNSVERKYASWLGGSILASLGTFHQLWISAAEYKEQGKTIINKRAR
ncbi:uncharacterized protein L969DRAFT_19049 [Mixia osmundae IAM 14324]|uniref:Actin-related protein 4 n=1 Tax=Mixia osmundae (strain CBS 9802 / IAM 14324 / JCM 22182 / KY 12970) TaxID=764103 RepID=G7DS19_MIXOS|nr:uncharacterized protein L969DRAFT_19049 [Mixia osmundae IAM 14324]KEI37567.1 hypothetical protein L969DRAFT_19049 [Mixia osmundae IAM 14324]GAA93379.1 hypothetical protein E5Q_00019 [Mixia osmundae IAM 14324]